MSYRESNPAKMHLIQFTIVIVLMIITYLFATLFLLLEVMYLLSDSYQNYYFFWDFFELLPCLFPFVILYIIVSFSLSLWRRDAYGEQHAKASVRGFFFGILGLILPPVILIMAAMFSEFIEKIYLVAPFLSYCVPSCLVIGLYLFVRDIGGWKKGKIGLSIFLVTTGIMVFMLTMMMLIEQAFSDDFLTFSLISSTILTALNIVGLLFLLLGFVDAFKWTSENRPLIDNEQKQQMEMQQYQITMQQQTLELQREQIEMQMEQLNMLVEVRKEISDERNIQIPKEFEEVRVIEEKREEG